MKKMLFTLTICFGCFFINAQVGIGTDTPVTDLDIEPRAIGTGEFNGVLIPRVAAIPAVVAPAGTLIYVTGGATPGFYFSNGTAYVNVTDTLSATGPFFESGTTTTASNNTQNIFRIGQTSLGEDLAGSQLHVGSTAIVGSPRTTVGIRNLNSSTANVNTYSLDLNNLSTTTGTKYGIRNNVSTGGVGEHIGIENTIFDSGFAATSVTGIYSDVGATAGTSSVNYGIRSEIGSAASRGTNYAIYAYSQHGTTTSDPSYSGYFRGDNFAIRSEDDSDGYDLPTVDGTAGQVLTTDGTGNASWNDVNSAKLRVRATFSADESFTTSSAGGNSNFISWEDLIFDSELTTTTAYDESTGVFTAPRDGYYSFTINVRATFNLNSNEQVGLAMRKNSDVNGFYQMISYRGDEFGNRVVRTLSANVYLSNGDTIDLFFGYSQTLGSFNDLEANTSELIIIEH